MIIFYSRQSDCARSARKNKNAGTINFTSQIASSIYTVEFTKCEKFDAIFLTSRRSRLSLVCIFRQGYALLLSFVRFSRLTNGSPANRPNPARRSRNGRELSGKKFDEMSRPFPHICQAIAGQWQMQRRRVSARAARETTRNLARSHPATAVSQSAQRTMQHPANHPASRLAEILASSFQS